MSAVLTNLTLTAFRSYDRATLALAGGCILLTGQNGAGKTNVMEAISLLSPGRGLRSAKLSEFQKFGSTTPWAVSAKLDDLQLGTGRDPNNPDSARRIVMIEGQKTSPLVLSEYLAISWLTPAMDRLWTESPGTRRRFLDRLTLALDPAHGTRLNRYEDGLAERNRLLKDGQFDDRWLASIEHLLATEGIAVAAARREMLRELQAALAEEAHRDSNSPFPRPLLSLEGVESWLDSMPALLAEDKLRANLAQTRRSDATSGGTSLGPHRSDLLATHPDKGMPAALCSTGEQKALLISLILAHGAVIRSLRGEPPILLLDEVAAHLDETRRESLFRRLLSLGGQVILSGADSSLFTPLKGQVLCYEMGAGFARETALV